MKNKKKIYKEIFLYLIIHRTFVSVKKKWEYYYK